MKRGLVVAMALTVIASYAAAHDFWLVPVGDEIHGISGSAFPTSTNAVHPARLLEAAAVSRAGRTPLEVVGARDSILILRADPAVRGTFWAVVALHPRRIDLSASDFNEYLRHDGLPQIYAERARRGELDRPAVERYQKFAKALIIRPGSGSVALEPVGHRLEVVPLEDPSTLAPGDTLDAEVRFEGQALASLTVNAGWAGQPDSTHAVTAVADPAGRVRVPIGTAGLWYVRTIHMRAVAEPPFQWESYWASLTFAVR